MAGAALNVNVANIRDTYTECDVRKEKRKSKGIYIHIHNINI